jgi:hypothetical protein
MTFKIKNLAVKNFMSVGNATQAVQFDRKDLTLVLGQNLDLGGDDTGHVMVPVRPLSLMR